MIDFTKTGEVRIEQLRDEINKATQPLGVVFPARVLTWIPADEVVRVTNATDGVDATIDVEALATQYNSQLQTVIDNHVPTEVYFPFEQAQVNVSDVIDRLKLSALNGKTPQEQYDLIQGAIDGWTTLAEAKTALREWIPLLAVAVYHLVKGSD